MNLSIVSFLAWGLQEAKLFFNSQSILEQNKTKLDELITQVTEKLGIIEQDWNQQERTDNNENIRLIQDVRDILAQSSQLRNQLPNQPNMLSAYQMSREQINQELLQSLKMLEEYNNKIDQFIQHTRNITKTVIILRPKQAQNSQIYQIQIKLKLKAPPSIKKIFDDQPYYLKSEYKFNFEMEETGSSNKNVKTFIRDDFSKLGLFQSKLGLSIENLSKQNHCSLQMRYKVHFPKIRVLSNPQTDTPTPEPDQQSVIISQKDEQKYSEQFSLFLIVNSRNQVKVIREKTSVSLSSGQELELEEKDQIVFFQTSEDAPLLSYAVQNIHITKKSGKSNLEDQQN